jgi:multiple antibiotic resistance protein
MILAGESQAHRFGLPVLLAVCMAVVALAYVGLRLATRVSALLGQTGINVVTRVLGVLLAALATQYVADGVLGLWRG